MTDETKLKQEVTTTDPKPIREGRISKRLAEAVRLLLTGECKTHKAAAERVGMNYTHLCEALRKPHVRVFIERRTRETIANGSLRASARLVELLDASSEHVSLDASKHMLALNGHQPPAGPTALVNINIQAGYVIDLSDDPPAKVVDITPTRGSDNRGSGRATIDFCQQINSYCERTTRWIQAGKHMGSQSAKSEGQIAETGADGHLRARVANHVFPSAGSVSPGPDRQRPGRRAIDRQQSDERGWGPRSWKARSGRGQGKIHDRARRLALADRYLPFFLFQKPSIQNFVEA